IRADGLTRALGIVRRYRDLEIDAANTSPRISVLVVQEAGLGRTPILHFDPIRARCRDSFPHPLIESSKRGIHRVAHYWKICQVNGWSTGIRERPIREEWRLT